MWFSVVRKSQYRRSRFVLFLSICLFVSLFTIAQTNLTHRLLTGYLLSDNAPINKSRPTLFVVEQTERLEQLFQPDPGSAKRPDVPNFNKEMVIGIAVPTSKPLKLAISRVFVQDSVLTVRYIRMADTTTGKALQEPLLVLAIPKQTVLKTRLVENGKVVQTIQTAQKQERR